MGRFWSHLGVILGPRIRPGRGSENKFDFSVFSTRPPRATPPCDPGSAVLGPDRRGGVGEGFVTIRRELY